jgi:hypothetical protein
MTELDLKETGDYPFKSWSTFFSAFIEGLNTEDFDKSYPKYYKILDKYNNYSIIKTMITKYNLDPNEGLDEYIHALCYDGTRYADDGLDFRIIKFFIEKGAEFPTDLLFDTEPDMFDYDVDEEFSSYDIRARILDNLGKELKLDVSRYADWKNIEAKSIDEQEISTEELEDEEFMKNIRMQHLKSISEYLQNFEN